MIDSKEKIDAWKERVKARYAAKDAEPAKEIPFEEVSTETAKPETKEGGKK